MNIKRLFLLLVMVYSVQTQAQIGYQISLLNTATGEPRANETVNVTVTLTNSEGSIIYTGNQSATTNDFGVLSLTIGDADTFKEVDFSKLPFFIEASANGASIGKSQVLSVPVAEAAKKIVPIDKSLILGTWTRQTEDVAWIHTFSYTFNADGTATYRALAKPKREGSEPDLHEGSFIYEIEGSNIYILYIQGTLPIQQFLRYSNGRLYGGATIFTR